ncbi:TlpA disulfide reductase family protein [Ureibacillus sp. FSL K6-8385]|uniref:TlpA family protein disulfide reductase n=1 Tax=Ureibacillus terrenus TaxID=118246 RepID=A0A540V6R7_9BACL|nr:TlpA disulfide reductase family protein [Ureibacillus terrenus]MED3660601.1 TlpA disulfide reductase family protein [Ureibacillus terrenus]MED3762721.1 TlpA disulfide reductase family protein [Ureibacillus terrenus]TQE92405.1 TlpA family protein disulfide reductase [Ureibacillus terrenus]
MERTRRSIFFFLLLICAFVWTIYSHFIKGEKGREETFTEEEFIDFLYQNLGLEEPHDRETLEETDGHHHDGQLETAFHSADFEAKNFQLRTLKNDTIRLSDLKGKQILINFWTSWCPPCKEEMRQLSEFYEQYAKKRNIEILAINVTDQEWSKDDVKKFAAQYQLKFPVLLDETGEVSESYQIMTIPTSFIINEEGKVTEKIVGPVTKDMLSKRFQ